MDYLSARILKIAEDELPKQSWDLSVIGIDVLFGAFPVKRPDDTIQPMQTFALVIAVRPVGPGGGVLLGNAEPVTNAHVYHSLFPAEAEVRASILTSCNAIRENLDQVANRRPSGLVPGKPHNGQGPYRKTKDRPQA